VSSWFDPEDRVVIAIVGMFLGTALTLVLIGVLLLSCASSEPAREGTTIDPCVACWDACGRTDAFAPTLYCSQECNSLCAVLRQDGGA
jgi:hypothetical protein